MNITIENLQEELNILQSKHFTIINCYIMGNIKVSDIKDFENILKSFENKVLNFNVSEENLLEIAKMKSKIQHYKTEILEDEDVLKVAYQNTFTAI